MFGKCANDVVGFHAVDHDTRPAQRFGDLADVADLVRKIFGHRCAIGFVLAIDVVAKGFASGVKHAGAIICRVVNAKFVEHIGHTEDRTGGFTCRRTKIRHGVKSAIKKARNIDEQQAWA